MIALGHPFLFDLHVPTDKILYFIFNKTASCGHIYLKAVNEKDYCCLFTKDTHKCKIDLPIVKSEYSAPFRIIC